MTAYRFVIATLLGTVCLLPVSSIAAQFQTNALFYNYAKRTLLMDMGDEVRREVNHEGGDAHSSYFSPNIFDSKGRVYRLRWMETNGSLVCDAYIRIHTKDGKMETCVAQSLIEYGAKCTLTPTLVGSTAPVCKAELRVDD
ncbi:hypothetical protein EDC65_3266 [Stella humosa]|uniref:Uncharacterized protein n=1 Tax=Stella humosa TaxID=94 RepID=A0A3N1LKY1_9PROT|nr:hypothetical protein [Stella humosa]ROP91399.1 hypothetical protein EDC65_3266 [Stella humosa]BBK34241.1 hypothetical protein STHU_48750 [Stella humosa]